MHLTNYMLLTLIRESWGKHQICRTVTERVFRGENKCFGNRARCRSQKFLFIFLQCDISPLILAYAISNLYHNIAQLTPYLYI